MIRGHYDEEELVELFERGEQSIARDPHVRTCAACKETIESIALFADTLKSPDVWEGPELSPEPNAQVLATLRAAQQRMRSEDEEAEENVKQLLAGPRESWSPRLQEHPEWRTAGMVRKLIAATDRAIETMPPDALEIAAIAVEIAEGLGADGVVDASLRVGALREKAFGLYFTSHYSDALADVARAESILSDRQSIDFGRLLLLRALITADLEDFVTALALTREAAEIFLAQHASGRYAAARRTEAIVLFRLKRFNEALRIHHELERDCADRRERAALHQNIALCYRELRQFDVAGRYFTSCITEFEALGMPVNVAKARWHFGRVLIAQGRCAAAVDILLRVRDEFSTVGMTHDAAIVTVDIGHAMMLSGRDAECAEFCRSALAYFGEKGLVTSEAALSALSLLKESATTGALNEHTFVLVRSQLSPDRRPRLYTE